MSMKPYVITLLGMLMKQKMNLFYKQGHQMKLNLLSNNKLKFNLEPGTLN